MVRARLCAIMGLCLMLQAASTEAREVEFFIENRLGMDSNIFRRAEGASPSPAKSGFYELSPRISVRDEQDALTYDVRYQPTYEHFFATDGQADGADVSGLDHSARGDFRWQPSQRTTVSGDGSFYRNRRLRQNFRDVGPVPDAAIDSSDNERIQRGRGSVNFSHSMSPRFSAQTSYSYDNMDFNRREFSDSESHTASIGMNYAVSPKTTFGLTGSARFRESRASVGDVLLTEFRSRTRTIDLSFTVSHQFSERVELSISVGPSFINTEDEQSNIPTNPNPDTSDLVQYSADQSIFAVVSGVYRWKNGNAKVGYTRSEAGGGGGTSAASIVDDISVNLYHRLDRDWTVRLGGGWNNRSSVSSNAFFGLDTRVERVYVRGSIERRLTPRVALIASARWSNQTADQFRFLPRFDRTTESAITSGYLSLRYTFEPRIF